MNGEGKVGGSFAAEYTLFAEVTSVMATVRSTGSDLETSTGADDFSGSLLSEGDVILHDMMCEHVKSSIDRIPPTLEAESAG